MSLLLAFIIALAPLSWSGLVPTTEAPLPSYTTEVHTSPAPSQAPSQAPVEAVPEAPVQAPTEAPVEDSCEEDMPCWVGSANDNRINPEDTTASPNDRTLTPEEAAAWLSLDTSTGGTDVPEGMILDYVKTVDGPYTAGFAQFTVQDTETEGRLHVFQFMTLAKA